MTHNPRRFSLTDCGPRRSAAEERWRDANAPVLDRPIERPQDAPTDHFARWEWMVANGSFGSPHA